VEVGLAGMEGGAADVDDDSRGVVEGREVDPMPVDVIRWRFDEALSAGESALRQRYTSKRAAELVLPGRYRARAVRMNV
jgi:hypothetical protein